MLAIHGGTPVRTKKFDTWPRVTALDRGVLHAAVMAADFHSGGRRRLFEDQFAADCGVKHCFCVANGTVSLELILRAYGIGYGDEVILPPYTFVATLSSIVFAGATPVFADIARESYLLDPKAVEQKITVSDDLVAAKIAELKDVYKKSPEALKNLKDPNVKMDIKNRMIIEATLDFLVKANS